MPAQQNPQERKPDPSWKGKAVPVIFPITTEATELETTGIVILKKHIKGPWRGMFEAYEISFDKDGNPVETRIQPETTIDMVLNAIQKNLMGKAYPSK
jgi:hypothetical protein